MVPAIQYEPEFDAARHVYTWQGQRRVSVTQVLDATGHKCKFYKEGHYKDRGTAVHFVTELHDQGELDEPLFRQNDLLLPPPLRICGFYDGWCEFLADTRPEIIYLEKRVFSPALNVAGTIDRVIKLAGQYGVLDLKTGTLPESAAVQTAGYSLILFDGQIPPSGWMRWALQLKANGKYKLKPYTSGRDYLQFIKAVKDYNQRMQEPHPFN